MAITGSTVTIMIKDMDKSIAFYESIGLTLKDRWGNHYAQVLAPGIVIGLHPTDDADPTKGTGNMSIGFTTDDFEETKSLLEKLSIDVTQRDEEGGQFLHFNDPDGSPLYFIKPKW